MENNKSDCKMEIIYVTSPWCGPCKQQTPVVEELGKIYGEEVVVKKDVSNEEDMKWAVDSFIMSTPTIIVRYNCKQPDGSDGVIDKMFQGFTNKNDIISYIDGKN